VKHGHEPNDIRRVFVRTRIKDSTFDDLRELDKVFGTQVLYRGQSRGWNIVPSIWRSPEQRENEKRLNALAAFWQYWASPEHDFAFDLFGKIEDAGSTAAMAQHYGLPTSLVDLTFDPRIAMWFACSETQSEPIAELPATLRNCAVVYFTSFYKLVSVSKLQIRLPHPAATRIYHQSGCFVDYGPSHSPYLPFWIFSTMDVAPEITSVRKRGEFPQSSTIPFTDISLSGPKSH
jgi:hypothetical protein